MHVVLPEGRVTMASIHPAGQSEKTGSRPKHFPSFHWNSLWVIIAASTLELSLIAVVAITMIVYRHADAAINHSIEQNAE